MAAPTLLQLRTERTVPIVFDALRRLGDLMRKHLPGSRAVVVTDENVAAHYLREVQDVLEADGRAVETVVLPAGEQTKSHEQLLRLYDTLLPSGLERDTPILALGGGVVGDLAGFAAATLLRGLPLVQLPTSCVAQVDSSLGGKTGINHATGKNLIGSFYQPTFVLTDTDTLQTLPRREWTGGLAEVVKHALLAGGELFALLVDRWDEVIERDPETLARLIPAAARVKVDIVQEDLLESGKRAWLNLGHTIGHAIEKTVGYGEFTHGEAVTVGMRVALRLSAHRAPTTDLAAAENLVSRLPTPATQNLDPHALWKAMRYDKKTRDGRPRFVLLNALGDPYLADGIGEDLFLSAWADSAAG